VFITMTVSPHGLRPAHDASAGLPRLPRGPHRLSRQEVERSQRERLLVGAAEAVAAKGYAATSVADILERAGVSRTTFYQLFDDKLACFVAAYRMAAEVVAAVMAEELAQVEGDAELTPLDRLDRLLGSYLHTLAGNPVLARVFLVEVYAAGAPAIQQRCESLAQFVDLVVATHDEAPGRLIGADPEQRFAVEVLVGAVSSMVTNAVGVGETESLPALRGPLMRLAGRIIGDGKRQTDLVSRASAATER
jgi:AcrR family transcriptional regulator